MPVDDQDAVDRLDQELDRFLSDAADSADRDLDASASAHRRVQELDSTPGPDPRFVGRLMEDLMHAMPLTASPTTHPLPNGRIAPPLSGWAPTAPPVVSRVGGPSRRWPVAVAAAILLLLAGAGLALDRGLIDRGTDKNRVVPAAVALASPTTSPDAVIAEETLVDIELPAGLVPEGSAVFGSLLNIFFPAGTTSWAAFSDVCCPGVRVDYVLRGSFTAQAGGPSLVVRADGTTETIPMGGTATVGVGDAMIVANDAGTTYTNAGPDDVELLFFVLYDERDGGYTSDVIPQTWSYPRQGDYRGGFSLPDGPARLRLQRIDLAPHATLPAIPLRFALSRIENDEGTPVPPVLFVGHDGAITNDGDAPLTVYVVMVESTADVSGTPVASPVP